MCPPRARRCGSCWSARLDGPDAGLGARTLAAPHIWQSRLLSCQLTDSHPPPGGVEVEGLAARERRIVVGRAGHRQPHCCRRLHFAGASRRGGEDARRRGARCTLGHWVVGTGSGCVVWRGARRQGLAEAIDPRPCKHTRGPQAVERRHAARRPLVVARARLVAAVPLRAVRHDVHLRHSVTHSRLARWQGCQRKQKHECASRTCLDAERGPKGGVWLQALQRGIRQRLVRLIKYSTRATAKYTTRQRPRRPHLGESSCYTIYGIVVRRRCLHNLIRRRSRLLRLKSLGMSVERDGLAITLRHLQIFAVLPRPRVGAQFASSSLDIFWLDQRFMEYT
mmetsp:Transcript_80691/g.216277  ORF Transcript_80691/g.216277 Transcript_80691/m.216277 type:complete len:337 (+) Transcript_80691:729-1739(+)